IIFAAYNCLPRIDDFRCEDDRGLNFMRIGAVSAYAPDSDIDEVDVCRRISFGHANVPSWNIGFVMKTKRKIRFSQSIIESVLQQRASAGTNLLRWLRHEKDRAVPLIF